MSKKKKRRIETGGIVFSTNSDFEPQDDYYEEESLPPNQQDLRIHVNRLKGNKKVTVIKGFVGPEEDMKDLCKQLKTKCGSGGSVKEGEIIIQGEVRDKVGTELEKQGYKFKFSGG